MSGSSFSSGEASSGSRTGQAPEGLGVVADLGPLLSALLPPLPALASTHTRWLGPRAAPASLGWNSLRVAAQRKGFCLARRQSPRSQVTWDGKEGPDLPLPDCPIHLSFPHPLPHT